MVKNFIEILSTNRAFIFGFYSPRFNALFAERMLANIKFGFLFWVLYQTDRARVLFDFLFGLGLFRFF